MADITKVQAITLLAQVYNRRRLEDETDVQLVQRIRNKRRAKADARRDRAYAEIDASLKAEAKSQYYILNPDDEEVVADFD